MLYHALYLRYLWARQGYYISRIRIRCSATLKCNYIFLYPYSYPPLPQQHVSMAPSRTIAPLPIPSELYPSYRILPPDLLPYGCSKNFHPLGPPVLVAKPIIIFFRVRFCLLSILARKNSAIIILVTSAHSTTTKTMGCMVHRPNYQPHTLYQ